MGLPQAGIKKSVWCYHGLALTRAYDATIGSTDKNVLCYQEKLKRPPGCLKNLGVALEDAQVSLCFLCFPPFFFSFLGVGFLVAFLWRCV